MASKRKSKTQPEPQTEMDPSPEAAGQRERYNQDRKERLSERDKRWEERFEKKSIKDLLPGDVVWQKAKDIVPLFQAMNQETHYFGPYVAGAIMPHIVLPRFEGEDELSGMPSTFVRMVAKLCLRDVPLTKTLESAIKPELWKHFIPDYDYESTNEHLKHPEVVLKLADGSKEPAESGYILTMLTTDYDLDDDVQVSNIVLLALNFSLFTESHRRSR